VDFSYDHIKHRTVKWVETQNINKNNQTPALHHRHQRWDGSFGSYSRLRDSQECLDQVGERVSEEPTWNRATWGVHASDAPRCSTPSGAQGTYITNLQFPPRQLSILFFVFVLRETPMESSPSLVSYSPVESELIPTQPPWPKCMWQKTQLLLQISISISSLHFLTEKK
jgi:hypothetical protein